ncbi:MAG: insulinase family protein [Ignavibacteriales bacterium]|nr:insulinase family protein [Ignavibacteriales bacterium]MCF8305148.1 insulinase family protein [Ignavibacteriales bacterium]MCF8314939.1 insulinase family protein [Ignavibacteriales bacterium]MCF8436112.1 insulinase family protein [Ignavibacteriales bacterium]
MNRISDKIPASVFHSTNLPVMNRLDLGEGLTLIHHEVNSLPIVNLNFIIPLPLISGEKSGTAYITSNLLNEGAGKLNAFEIDDLLESMGTTLSVHASADNFYLSILTLTENLEKSISLARDILMTPHLNESDFLRERERIRNRVVRMSDDASYLAETLFQKIVFNNSVYESPVTGFLNDLNKLAIEDVRNFYQNRIKNIAASVVSVGNIKLTELAKLIQHFLPDRRISAPSFQKTDQFKIDNTTIYFIKRKDSKQSEIILGQPTGGRKEKRLAEKIILNSVLGGPFSSRLNQNLREKHGYTYGISSGFNFNKHLSAWQLSTGVDSENTYNALKQILFEIERLEKGVSDNEFQSALDHTLKSIPLQFETQTQITNKYSNLISNGLAHDYFENFIKILHELSIEQVNEYASEFITKKGFVIVVVGERIEPVEKIAAEMSYNLKDVKIEDVISGNITF